MLGRLEDLSRDLRYAIRSFVRAPVPTTLIVLSLALGIGANTAVFNVTSTLLLKPLPYPHPDRIAILWLRSPAIGIPQDWPSPSGHAAEPSSRWSCSAEWDWRSWAFWRD